MAIKPGGLRLHRLLHMGARLAASMSWAGAAGSRQGPARAQRVRPCRIGARAPRASARALAATPPSSATAQPRCSLRRPADLQTCRRCSRRLQCTVAGGGRHTRCRGPPGQRGARGTQRTLGAYSPTGASGASFGPLLVAAFVAIRRLSLGPGLPALPGLPGARRVSTEQQWITLLCDKPANHQHKFGRDSRPEARRARAGSRASASGARFPCESRWFLARKEGVMLVQAAQVQCRTRVHERTRLEEQAHTSRSLGRQFKGVPAAQVLHGAIVCRLRARSACCAGSPVPTDIQILHTSASRPHAMRQCAHAAEDD